ncbi:zinc finger domain-containing protein [Streptomyces ipomoeae]|uniref:zinc finger domain-containing protein n=1 Tax=Streptomyces ipomoeae TaxID=103232 RepID=UPI001147338A|nr:hypothetical protein [Streptomyces ipomoeae]TQE33171.1 hypothetical protein Sipo7851_22015 [Streptomyces ipomoeae]
MTNTTEPARALPQITVACPPAPDGCGSAAGELCTSHNGTRVRRHQVHQARTAAWEAKRIAASSAAQVVADTVKERRIRHGQHAVNLLREHGYGAEADLLQREVRARNGLMSAKQAVDFLLEPDQDKNGDDVPDTARTETPVKGGRT